MFYIILIDLFINIYMGGCQCTKSNEQSNMNLETAPPRLTEIDKPTKTEPQPIQEVKPEPVNESKVNESVSLSKDQSNIKKKTKKKKTDENFVQNLFELINTYRANPKNISSKIIEAISKIKSEEGKTIYEADGVKVALQLGEAHFRTMAAKLEGINPLPPLEYRQDLAIQPPEDNKEWKNNKIISELLAKKKTENGDRYISYAFNMDLGVSDPEICLLLQIIDDSPFKGKRSEALLSDKHKYVGIGYSKQKSKFCCYLTFAK